MTLELTSRPSAVPHADARYTVDEHTSVAPDAPDHLGRPPDRIGRTVTALIVGIPLLALVVGVVSLWGRGVGPRDVALGIGLFFLTGHGISIGFHRLLAHKSFVASRPLKVVLAVLGSMAFEGGPIGWVAHHRRHHVFSDTADDPHSPHHSGRGVTGRLRGLWHAHVGWLFTARAAQPRRHAADLLADRDLVVIDALFPVWCVVSLAVPFGLGWLLGGTVTAALGALLWAGLVRVGLLHHVTWSVNSVCHMFGRRPFATKDHSGNVAALALLSMGESWHNGHHAFPRSFRHGLLRGQVDTSARLIQLFQRLGWARDLHAPSADAIRYRAATAPATVRAHLRGGGSDPSSPFDALMREEGRMDVTSATCASRRGP